jgi:hypothetical protein
VRGISYPNVTQITTSTTPTPNSNITDLYVITALASTATFGAPTGSPNNGQVLNIRIHDDGTAHSLSWNGSYAPIGLSLPTVTVPNKYLYVGTMYNSQASNWSVLATGQE